MKDFKKTIYEVTNKSQQIEIMSVDKCNRVWIELRSDTMLDRIDKQRISRFSATMRILTLYDKGRRREKLELLLN